MNGGGGRNRTDDLPLAKQLLAQLSYTLKLVRVTGFEPMPASCPVLASRRRMRNMRQESNLRLSGRLSYAFRLNALKTQSYCKV